jgi:hypothetical protein
MTQRDKTRLLILLGLTFVALMLLSSGLGGLDFRAARSLPFSVDLPLREQQAVPQMEFLGTIWRTVVAIFLLVFVPIFAYVLIKSPEVRREVFKRILTAALLLLFFYILLSRLQRTPQPLRVESSPLRSTAMPLPTATAVPAAPPLAAEPPQWLVFAITALLVIPILAAFWFFWRRSGPALQPPQPEEATLVAGEAHEALRSLQAGQDVRDTVLRCYLDMSRVLSERRAIRREQGMTPREFEQRLATAGVRDEHIRRLTQLFEQIRYGGRAPGEAEEAEAVACLTAIVEAYGSPA